MKTLIELFYDLNREELAKINQLIISYFSLQFIIINFLLWKVIIFIFF